jgi:alkyl hydroperoxide reductase subunit AhpC
MRYALMGLMFLMASAAHALETGKPAPDFTALSSDGKTVKLSDYKGKNVVVLEWLNHGCPFVKRHYGSKNIPDLQKQYTGDKSVVWLSVISSAPGKQGHSSPEQAEADRKKMGSSANAILLDEKGEVGKLYSAETTPHMFVINKEGILVYQGAIDDSPHAKLEETKKAKSFLREALDLTLEGKAVKTAQKKAYGCNVKYN